MRRLQATIVQDLNSKGADIASAATTDLGAVAGLYHDITGTTTITGLGTVRAGVIKVIRFRGVLTFTHNVTSLILPNNGSNITTADGDHAFGMSLGSGNWVVLMYTKANGLPIADSNIVHISGAETVTGNKTFSGISTLSGNTLLPAMTRGMSPHFVNGTLVHSRAANAETIAIKTLAGTDPTATDPVYVVFRNVTAGTGDYAVITITAATSFVISSGSTLGASSATAFRVWIVGFNDGGTFRLGVINCRSGVGIYSLNGWGIASSTAEGGAGAADTAQVFYTGTAVTSKAYVTLGYSTWESGLTTAGTWDAAPTRTQLYGPGVPLPNQTIQTQVSQDGVAASGATAIPYDNTIPQNTEGDQFMSRAITSTSAANVFDIFHKGIYGSVADQFTAALFQDTTAGALKATSFNGATSQADVVVLVHRMLAAVTTETTFKVRAGRSGGGSGFNGHGANALYGGVGDSALVVKEVMA